MQLSTGFLGARPSLDHPYGPAAAESKSANSVSSTLDMVDKTVSGMSLAAEAFIKKGLPKMSAQLFLAKAGVFTNMHGAATSWKQGAAVDAGLSLAKSAASLGTARFYNAADGLANASQGYRQYQAGDMRAAMQSGARLALNAASLFAPPPLAIASAAVQFGMQFT